MLLGRPPCASGYPTPLPPSGGRPGGFNVSYPAVFARRDGAPGGFCPPSKTFFLSQEKKLLAKPSNLSVRTVRGEKRKTKNMTTLSGGSLGSCVDEERS